MWAVEKYVGHWDGYSGLDSPNHPNNYHLHSDGLGLFTLLPWGTDQTLVERIPFDGTSAVMFDRCLADSVCGGLFREAVTLARTTIPGLDLEARAAGLASELTPWQAIDPRREYTPGQTANAVEATRAFIAARPGDADAWLAAGGGVAPSASQPLSSAQAAVRSKRCKRKRPAKARGCKKRKPAGSR